MLVIKSSVPKEEQNSQFTGFCASVTTSVTACIYESVQYGAKSRSHNVGISH